MEKISIQIDDQDILAPKGSTILEAALANNIFIPHLCYHPDLKPAGSCRVCLAELDNGKFVASCRTPVQEGMVIKTKSSELDNVRRPVIEMIIANHHMNCKHCLKKGKCTLQKIMAYMKIDKKRIQENLRLPKEELPLDESNPFFLRDHNKCVLCGICVRTCAEIQRVNAIDFACRGNTTKIATFGDKPIAQSICESCGECVIRCPVGALVVRNPQRPSEEVKTVCPYCGVGCGILLGIKDKNIVSVRGDQDNPVNKGHLCAKGRFGISFVHSPDRLKKPFIKMTSKERKAASIKDSVKSSAISAQISALFKEVSWDKAIDTVTKKLKKYKGEEIAVIASTKCTNEDQYITQKFARVALNTNNIDTTVRLCHAPSVAALNKINGLTIGMDLEADIEKAACILVVGANVTRSHPVLGLKIKKAVENGARLIVISPGKIDLCQFADMSLNPYPGTDLALIMGMCSVIVDEQLHDDTFTQQDADTFEEFKESVEDFSLGRVERITGVPRDAVEEVARIYAQTKPAAILWSTGITQYGHGTNNVLSLLNLSLLTGNIRHSSSLIPLWGQNNTLGACSMGCLPDFYPGLQPVSDARARKSFEKVWQTSLKPETGLTLMEILDATRLGKIKALYIIGSDLITKIAPSKKVKQALKKAKFIAYQDIFPTETAKFAHVILPVASFAEKDGFFTNTEGKVQRIFKAIDTVGDTKPDWQIMCELAKRLKRNGFDFNSSEEITSEISSVMPKYPEQKERDGFVPLQYKPPTEVSDIDYPLLLTTERDLYSGGTLSKYVEGLELLRTKDNVFINPKDAADFGIEDGDAVRVISQWGEIHGQAQVSASTSAGLITVNFMEEKINQLLNPSLDPEAKIPETKICAVKIASMRE